MAWGDFPEVAITDVSWLFTGVISLLVAIKYLKVKTTDKPRKEVAIAREVLKTWKA